MRQNRTRMQIWIFLAALSISLLVIGQRLAERHGLLAGFLLAAIVNTVIFLYGDLRLLRRFRERKRLEGRDPWGLLAKLEALCEKADLPVPRLFLIELDTPTALSIGVAAGSNAILVSDALVREFTPTEVEAVLAFEVARLKRQATAASTVAAALTGGLSWIARALDNVLFLQFLRRKKPCQLRPTSALVSPLIGLIARIAISGRTYLQSDALAASLIEDPRRMAHVIWKLHSYQKTKPFDVPASDTPLFMVNPLTACVWYQYFQVQPAVERRIRLLIGYFPI